MKLRRNALSFALSMLCLLVVGTNIAYAQHGGGPGGGGPGGGSPLGFLKKALQEAGAQTLTTDQETQLTALITAFQTAHPHTADQALIDAHTAYESAILSGNATALQTAIATLIGLQSTAHKTLLTDIAKFDQDVFAILTAGGQLDALKTKFGADVVEIAGSLVGGGHGGPGGPGGK
jgi:hypothetical protein